MSSWLLPLAAAALWAGLWARGFVAGRAPWWLLLFLGGLALAGGWAAAPRRVAGSGPLEASGLAEPPPSAVAAVRPPRLVGRRSPAVLAVCLATGLGLTGMGWGLFRDAQVSNGVLARAGPAHVEVAGSLRTDPRPGQFGWTALLGVSEVTEGSARTRVRETVWLQGNGPLPAAHRGDRIWAEGYVRVPDDPGFAGYLASRGIAAELSADRFERVGPSSNPLVRLAGAARLALGRSFRRFFDQRESGLLMGLSLGDTSGLDEGMARDFKATGLTHLLAVSGENVAMVLAPMMALALLLRLGPTAKFLVGAVTVLFFVVLTGGEPSVLRAGVMAGIALTGTLLGRPRSTWAVLGGAVLVLLLVDPFLVPSVGFQLSVAATVGIASLASPLAARLAFLSKGLATVLATSISAQLGVAPLLLAYFHWVPGSTLVANLAAFPAVGPALVLGLAAAAAGLVFSPLGWILSRLALVPMRYLEWIADRFATAPIPSITSAGGLAPVVGGAILLLALTLWVRSGWRPPRKLVVLAVGVLPLFVWSSALGSGPPSGLVVRFLDVGQGDAALITSPDGANVLVDGGPDPELAATKLSALGVKRLDAVVATHQHADHVEGLPEVLARFPVGLVLDPGCSDPTTPSYDAFLSAVSEEGTPERHPRTGDVYRIGDLTFDVLSPDDCYHDTHSDPNNDSIVFLLEYMGDTVLFTGDAEVEAQQVMLEEHQPVTAEVLKVPHHGGDTSLPGFFDAVHAQLAVVSVGQPNDYGHPVPKVLEEIAVTGARIERTDEAGDVTLSFSGRGIEVASAA